MPTLTLYLINIFPILIIMLKCFEYCPPKIIYSVKAIFSWIYMFLLILRLLLRFLEDIVKISDEYHCCYYNNRQRFKKKNLRGLFSLEPFQEAKICLSCYSSCLIDKNFVAFCPAFVFLPFLGLPLFLMPKNQPFPRFRPFNALSTFW